MALFTLAQIKAVKQSVAPWYLYWSALIDHVTDNVSRIGVLESGSSVTPGWNAAMDTRWSFDESSTSATAYVIAIPDASGNAMYTGAEITVYGINQVNTGAATLNVGTTDGAVSIQKEDASGTLVNLEAGDLQPSVPARLFFDGTYWILRNPLHSQARNVAGLAPYKNKLINSAFDLWERGTSFTVAAYCADRWAFQLGTGGAATLSRQTHTPGDSQQKYYLRHNRTTLASAASKVLYQRIEGVRTFQGKTVTVSIRCKAAVAKTFTVNYIQDFGTGGSPSSDVTGTAQSISVTTSFATHTVQLTIPSISSKTLGTENDDFLEIAIREDASFSTFTLDVEGVQIEEGSTATEFEKMPIGITADLCRRYYVRMNFIDIGNRVTFGQSLSTTLMRGNVSLTTPMRATPSISYGTASWYEVHDGVNTTVTSMSIYLYMDNQITLQANVASGLTIGDACSLRAASVNAEISFSAEL